MRKNRTVMASVGVFAGITAGLVGLFTPTAQATADKPTKAAHSHASDCKRAPVDVRALCGQVYAQFPYAFTGKGGGLNQVPAGNLIVREIVHQGLTKGEIRSALRGEARTYRQYATGSRTAIVVDLASLADLCGTDGQYIVGRSDDDGRPHGRKSVRVEIDCP